MSFHQKHGKLENFSHLLEVSDLDFSSVAQVIFPLYCFYCKYGDPFDWIRLLTISDFHLQQKICPIQLRLLECQECTKIRGAWVAQSVECPAAAQVMISWFVSSSPASGSVLTAQSLELLWILCLLLSLHLPLSCSVSFSLSLKHKH